MDVEFVQQRNGRPGISQSSPTPLIDREQPHQLAVGIGPTASGDGSVRPIRAREAMEIGARSARQDRRRGGSGRTAARPFADRTRRPGVRRGRRTHRRVSVRTERPPLATRSRRRRFRAGLFACLAHQFTTRSGASTRPRHGRRPGSGASCCTCGMGAGGGGGAAMQERHRLRHRGQRRRRGGQRSACRASAAATGTGGAREPRPVHPQRMGHRRHRRSAPPRCTTAVCARGTGG